MKKHILSVAFLFVLGMLSSSYAAPPSSETAININDKQWNKLSDEDKNKVKSIFESLSGKTKTVVKLVPNKDTPIFSEEDEKAIKDKASTLDWRHDMCIAECNIKLTAAVTACNALSGPAVAVCLLVAREEYNNCVARC